MREPRRPLARPVGLVGDRPPGRALQRAAELARVLSDSAADRTAPERAAPHRWGLVEAVLGFATGLVLAAVAASVAAQAVGYRTGGGRPVPVAVTVADVAGLWVGLVGAAVLAVRLHGTGSLVRDLGLRLRSPLDVVGGLALGAGFQLIVIPAVYWPFEQLFPGLPHALSAPARQETGAAHGLGPVLVLLAFLAVGAPLVEELFFRGLVLRGLLGHLPVPVAVVVSALAFGLAHFEGVQLGGLVLFGVALGVLAWRTGRLGPGIAAHAGFNAVAVLTLAHFR